MYGTVSPISPVPVGGVNALTHVRISFTSWVQYVYACSYKCSYAVRDFVLLLACGDCPDDGLLLPLRFEEGSLLPVLLSFSDSHPLDGIIGPVADRRSLPHALQLKPFTLWYRTYAIIYACATNAHSLFCCPSCLEAVHIRLRHVSTFRIVK